MAGPRMTAERAYELARAGVKPEQIGDVDVREQVYSVLNDPELTPAERLDAATALSQSEGAGGPKEKHYSDLKDISAQLAKASKLHKGQSDRLAKMSKSEGAGGPAKDELESTYRAPGVGQAAVGAVGVLGTMDKDDFAMGGPGEGGHMEGHAAVLPWDEQMMGPKSAFFQRQRALQEKAPVLEKEIVAKIRQYDAPLFEQMFGITDESESAALAALRGNPAYKRQFEDTIQMFKEAPDLPPLPDTPISEIAGADDISDSERASRLAAHEGLAFMHQKRNEIRRDIKSGEIGIAPMISDFTVPFDAPEMRVPTPEQRKTDDEKLEEAMWFETEGGRVLTGEEGEGGPEEATEAEDEAELQRVMEAMEGEEEPWYQAPKEWVEEQALQVGEGVRRTGQLVEEQAKEFAEGPGEYFTKKVYPPGRLGTALREMEETGASFSEATGAQDILAASSVVDPTLTSDVGSATLYLLEGDTESARNVMLFSAGGLGAGPLAAKLRKMRKVAKERALASGASMDEAERVAAEVVELAETMPPTRRSPAASRGAMSPEKMEALDQYKDIPPIGPIGGTRIRASTVAEFKDDLVVFSRGKDGTPSSYIHPDYPNKVITPGASEGKAWRVRPRPDRFEVPKPIEDLETTDDVKAVIREIVMSEGTVSRDVGDLITSKLPKMGDDEARGILEFLYEEMARDLRRMREAPQGALKSPAPVRTAPRGIMRAGAYGPDSSYKKLQTMVSQTDMSPAIRDKLRREIPTMTEDEARRAVEWLEGQL